MQSSRQHVNWARVSWATKIRVKVRVSLRFRNSYFRQPLDCCPAAYLVARLSVIQMACDRRPYNNRMLNPIPSRDSGRHAIPQVIGGLAIRPSWLDSTRKQKSRRIREHHNNNRSHKTAQLHCLVWISLNMYGTRSYRTGDLVLGFIWSLDTF